MNKSIGVRFFGRWFFTVAIILSLAQMSPAQEAILFRRDRLLRIIGTDGSDNIAVVVTGANFSVKRARPGIAPRDLVSIRDSVTGVRVLSLASASISRIEVWANDGSDLIDMRQSPVPVTVEGGDGDDIIYGSEFNDILYSESSSTVWSGTDSGSIGWIWGFGGHDLIFGGTGNDLLSGGDGDDVILGLEGDDWIWGGIGYDGLFGGRGADNLYGGTGTNDFYFDLMDYIDSESRSDHFIYTP